MKKIAILGANGMAGHVIYTFLKEKKYNVYGLARNVSEDDKIARIDVQDIGKLENWLDSNNFNIIINCVGILNKNAEDNIDQAIYLNSYLPHYLEKKYRNTNVKIIHISTDCVFSGRDGNYIEVAFKDGDTIYDRTKALGEIVNDKDLTFRTSIIGPDYNEKAIGLFNWFMKQNGDINGYTQAYWSGVTTIELAKAIHKAIEQDLTGLYHLCAKQNISKYELLKLFKKMFNRQNVNINPVENDKVDKTLINTRKDFTYEVPSYTTMLEEMKDWMNTHYSMYEKTYGGKTW